MISSLTQWKSYIIIYQFQLSEDPKPEDLKDQMPLLNQGHNKP